MNELISLLRALLNDGTVKIDLTMRISLEDRAVKVEGMHTAKCEKCGWSQRYYDSSAAARGLRSHQHHCPKIAVENGWIPEQKDSKS